MKTYVINYTVKSDNNTYSFLFHDGEYFGDTYELAKIAKYPQKISYWRSEWKKQLKGVKNIQVFKLDHVPFEFLEELNDIERKYFEHVKRNFFVKGWREKSLKYLYNNIMRDSYRQLIDILLYNMLNYYKPEYCEIPTEQKTDE